MPQKQVYSTMVALIAGDITKSPAEAIVNDANPQLKPARGPSKLIYEVAGPALSTECGQLVEREGQVPAGEVRVTGAGLLRAKYVIHAVSPVWQGGSGYEERMLGDTYQAALKAAADYSLKMVALTALGIGDHARFPVEKAAQVGVYAIEEFCRNDERLRDIQFIISDQFVYSQMQKAMTY
jgi:O-acetyl-ADP-ribose deacetylase (regulator of RNase III)